MKSKVHDVSLEVYGQTEESITFYADWEVKHWDPKDISTAPDEIEIMLLVDGEVRHSHVRTGVIGCIKSYKVYTEAPIASGTKVTFAARAKDGGKVQRWKQDSVVVP